MAGLLFRNLRGAVARSRRCAPKHSPAPFWLPTDREDRRSTPPSQPNHPIYHPCANEHATASTLTSTHTTSTHTYRRPIGSCISHLSESDRCEINFRLRFRKNLMRNGIWAASWAHLGTLGHSCPPNRPPATVLLRRNCSGAILEPSRNHPCEWQLIVCWRMPLHGAIAEPYWNQPGTIPPLVKQWCFGAGHCMEPSRNHPGTIPEPSTRSSNNGVWA